MKAYSYTDFLLYFIVGAGVQHYTGHVCIAMAAVSALVILDRRDHI